MFDPGDPLQSRFNGYGPARLPDPRDDELTTYVESLVAGGPEAVAKACSVASEKGRRVLRAYAERAASLAVRKGNPEILVRAIVAVAVGGLSDNALESLMVMAPIEDSARQIGLDLPEAFERASKIIGHPGTVNLMIWLTRRPEDRSLSSMGFVAGEDDDGFRYRLDW